ncbi:hypothetical protein [Actinophytocola xinjiangensis]|uniref:hypothetical protein n=1 Tax=Actinophytocola xinjiangensis TaxID=485602 RepID=UPI0012B8086C|nr:hypothetical protein [Actinophytocola xinjiangensis]
MAEDHRELAFDGASEFLSWLYALDRRPWIFTREKLLPIVYLRHRAPRKYLSALADHWTRLRRRGPRQCVVVAAGGGSGDDGVEQLLAAALARFSRRTWLGRGQRAPHFALASWLAALRREKPSTLSEAEVIAKIRNHHSRYELAYQEARESPDPMIRVPLDTISGLPWWIQLPAHLLPRAALRLADTVFGPQRWFERRGGSHRRVTVRGEAEPLRGTLFALAKRCAGIDGEVPSQRQIDALLADAFLQDLRRTYSRSRPLGGGRRRRTYPVLLLPSEGEPAPAALVRAITDVRNGQPRRGTVKRDPLLVVVAGRLAGDGPEPEAQEPGSPESAYEDWRADLAAAGRRQRVWLLAFEAPAQRAPQNERDRVRKVRPPGRVPWMSFASVLAVLAALVAVPVVNYEFCRPPLSSPIGLFPPEPRDEMSREDLGDVDQCVGLVGDSPPLVSPDLDDPIERIRQANAEALRAEHHLTVVHLTMLSPGTDQGVRATREELRGLAIAQRESLGSETPIRLLLANAGAGMRHADKAAREIIQAHHRERIDAVVGLGISTEETIAAVRDLGRAALPAIGSSTTADELLTASPFYYQVSVSNKRQAAFAAEYATGDMRASSARVYFSGDPADTYSSELATAIRDHLDDTVEITDHAAYRTTDTDDGESVFQLGREACTAAVDPDEIVVYAGRAERFGQFLNGMKSRCENRYPRILATDDVSRFVLEGTNRYYPNLRLDYIALASSALWGSECEAMKEQGSFYIHYDDLFTNACDENRDGRALLSFDALTLVRQAATNVLNSDPEFLWSQGIEPGLSKIRGEGRVSGVSGDLDYSDPAEPRAPANKAIMVLRITDTGQPCLVRVDGQFSSQNPITGSCEPQPGDR